MWHVLERALIHFVAATFLVLASWYALRFWLRSNGKVHRWVSPDPQHLLVTSALCVFALSTLREPIDVAMGQSAVKAITDFISWIAGAGCGAWGLYRFRKS